MRLAPGRREQPVGQRSTGPRHCGAEGLGSPGRIPPGRGRVVSLHGREVRARLKEHADRPDAQPQVISYSFLHPRDPVLWTAGHEGGDDGRAGHQPAGQQVVLDQGSALNRSSLADGLLDSPADEQRPAPNGLAEKLQVHRPGSLDDGPQPSVRLNHQILLVAEQRRHREPDQSLADLDMPIGGGGREQAQDIVAVRTGQIDATLQGVRRGQADLRQHEVRGVAVDEDSVTEVKPSACLDHHLPVVPVEEQGGDHSTARDTRLVDQPTGQGGSDACIVIIDGLVPLGFGPRAQRWPTGKEGVGPGVSAIEAPFRLLCALECMPRVAANGGELPEAGGPAGPGRTLGGQERAVHQLGEEVVYVTELTVARHPHDGAGQVSGEGPRQRGQSTMSLLLRRTEQLVAPLDRRVKGGAVVLRAAPYPAKSAGIGRHLGGDVVQRVAERAGRGQLKRQRQTVDGDADLRRSGQHVLVRL